jgi:ParB family transcriptional regulator, chromosome partitioning protein
VLAQYARLRPQPAEVPAELAEEIEQIEQRLGELEEIDADAFTNELAAEAERLEERRAEIDDLVESLAVYSDKDRARAGVIVTIGDRGEFRLHEGLVQRTTARAAPHREAGDGNAGDDDETWSPAEGGDVEPSPLRLSPEHALRKECGFSQSLVDDLKAHRHQITRAHLAGNFAVAFDLALYALCTEVFDHFRLRSSSIELRATEAAPGSSLNDLGGTAADRLLEAQRAALDLDWLNLPPAHGFAALAVLPPDDKQRLFAWCVASTLKPQLAIEDRADPVLEAAGRRLAILFADFWRPTAANYWGRVKKAHGLGIGQEILGPRWARDHADDKKPVLADALETAFDPAKSEACISLGQAPRDNAAIWLPPGMAYAAAEGSPPAELANPDAEAEAGDDIGLAADELPPFLTGDEPAALESASSS